MIYKKFQDLTNWVPDFESKYLSNETHYPQVALYNVETDPGKLTTAQLKAWNWRSQKLGLPVFQGKSLMLSNEYTE